MNIWQIIVLVETIIFVVLLGGSAVVARLLKQDEKETRAYNGKSN